jgi:hypothetical protein
MGPRVAVNTMLEARPPAAKLGEAAAAVAGHRGRTATEAGEACTPADLAVADLVAVDLVAVGSVASAYRWLLVGKAQIYGGSKCHL